MACEFRITQRMYTAHDTSQDPAARKLSSTERSTVSLTKSPAGANAALKSAMMALRPLNTARAVAMTANAAATYMTSCSSASAYALRGGGEGGKSRRGQQPRETPSTHL